MRCHCGRELSPYNWEMFSCRGGHFTPRDGGDPKVGPAPVAYLPAHAEIVPEGLVVQHPPAKVSRRQKLVYTLAGALVAFTYVLVDLLV